MVRNRVIRTLWEAWLYDGAPFEPALQSLIDAGMNATFDVPFFFAYEELHRRYPDAKVLLSVRDTPEDWYKSCHKFPRHHAVNAIVGRTLGDRLHVLISWALGFPGHCKHAIFTRPFRELLGCDFGVEDPAVMEQHCVDVYRKHIDKVRSTIPTQQLLVYNVKEGWKPLCDFLGVPVPDTPFPRTDWNNLFGVIWDVLTNKDTPAARVFKSVAVWIIALLAVAVAGLRLRASYRRGRFASEKPKAT